MKLVCLNGSPRIKGNSATIAARFCETAQNYGASVNIWYLNKLNCRGCQACYACKKNMETCALQDDLSEVLQTILDSDILILATPIYYGDVSAQTKIFIDRTFSFLVPDFKNAEKPGRLDPGKKIVFIISQGNPDEKIFNDVYPRYSRMFKMMGFEQCKLIRACGLNKSTDVLNREDILKQAENLAIEMVK